MKRLSFLTIAIVFSMGSQADIYRYKDSNGNWVFSDTPAPNSELIQVVVHNDVGAPVGANALTSNNTSAEETPVNYSLDIQTPAHEATIPPGQQTLSIQASLTPATPPGTTFRLLANGTPQLEGNRPNFALSGLIRGQLTLVVIALDQNGDTLAESTPVTVQVIRPSIQNQQRPGIGGGAGSIGNDTRPRQ